MIIDILAAIGALCVFDALLVLALVARDKFAHAGSAADRHPGYQSRRDESSGSAQRVLTARRRGPCTVPAERGPGLGTNA